MDLLEAIKRKDEVSAKAIISAGKIEDLCEPLICASGLGLLSVTKALLEAKANVNDLGSDSVSALHASANEGQVDCVKFLIEQKADVHAKMKGSSTPLYLSVQTNRIECIRELIRAKANLEVVYREDENVLAYAILFERRWTAEILLDAGAKVSNVSKIAIPTWIHDKVAKRRNAVACTFAFLGILRKRVGVCKDMSTLLAQFLWSTRFNKNWE
jgi:ankyrin repeat protein